MSVSVNKKQLEEKEINNIHRRQQQPKNNVKHEMFANIIHQKMKETTHSLLNKQPLYGADKLLAKTGKPERRQIKGGRFSQRKIRSDFS